MKRERYLRIYDLHSWSGICLGLFIYIVSFTGCLALFADEIKTWEAPELRDTLTDKLAPVMPQLNAWVESNSQDSEVDFIRFFYPSKHEPFYHSVMGVKPNESGVKQQNLEARWSATSGQEIPVRGGGLSEWVLDFHRDLMWPDFLGGRTAGRSLVGVAGIILMLSIVSGIITHTKIIKQMFSLRVERSNLLKWQDMHKVLGLWPLPFHIMISFTGAFLGIIAILAPLVAVLAFKGDTQALVQAVNGPETVRSGVHAQMLSVDQVWNLRIPDSQSRADGQIRPHSLVVDNWNDQAATYAILYPVDTELARFDRLEINAVTGGILKVDLANNVTPAMRVTNAISPLHYATFGGIWLKVLYAILGLILTMLTATGLIIWIERRLHGSKGRSSPTLYKRINKLIIGVTLGLPLASAAIFYLDKLYVGAEQSRLTATGITFFFVWFAAVLYSLARERTHSCVRSLFLITGLLIVLLPLLNYLTVGENLLQGLRQSASWAWVDVGALLVGLVTLAITFYLPTRRTLNPRERAGMSDAIT